MDWTDRIGRRVKLRDLHILLAVVRAGSMGKAAATMAMSQPVVSKAISGLEQSLGVRLLDRTPQGVEATAHGRAVLQCGVAVFDELRKGVDALAWLSDPSAGELRIGCTEAAAAGLVPAVIDQFMRRYPRVTFRIVTADTETLAERALPNREVDLAIGATPVSLKCSPTIVEPLFDDRHVVMAGARTKWRRRRGVLLAQLVDEPWVLPPATSVAGLYLAEAFAAAGVPLPAARVECFSMTLTQQLLATGRFLAILPIGVIRLGRYDSVKPVDIDWHGVPRTIGVMTLANRTLTPLAQAFVACVREMASPMATAMGSCARPTRGAAAPRKARR